MHQRLLFYKKIANAEDYDSLISIRSEMLDRFGSLPEPTKNLFAIHQIRLLAEALEISKIDGNERQVTFEFSPSTLWKPLPLLGLFSRIRKI